ncbi:sulfite exporter TauE/SafE family protein [Thalassotalea ponticola]|uniref:sulfite exporter TauE/SafE family protein n=1 Tax=Thalassotalea ponticola TaxID=1523392 RepID=UPI0025B2B2CB|nr:sulfite exporter TauE/SafE family protein [Thalassotalea ponticola]MDN3651200.1 sulfite exporter TauE/SafE family protein [Thalassotalea ponticola]
MTIDFLLLLLLLGAVVGVLSGLLGIGGGALLVPALTAVFMAMELPSNKVVHLALGTSMACIILTSLSSFWAHHRRGSVRWPIVGYMVPGILVGTFAATFIAAQIPSLYLAIFFAVFMSYVAMGLFINKPAKAGANVGSPATLTLVGSGIGAISALVSIGGGTLTVPYLSARNIPITQAIGTSAACGFPIALAGTLGYVINGLASNDMMYTTGFVYWPAVALIAVTSFFSAPVGVKLAHTLSVTVLKKLFAVFVVFISLNMIRTVIGSA